MTNHSLTNREIEVLKLLHEGYANIAIAIELAITTNTVKVHNRNIYQKLGVVSRTQAIREALRLGIITYD